MHPSPPRSSQRAPWRRPACPPRVVLLAALVCLAFPGPVAATPFATWQDLTGVANSDACWGDIDNDGDLDAVLCGLAGAGRVTRTYRNNGGTLVLLDDLTGIESEGSGALAWGDYDGDGDLDLAMAGASDSGNIARIYANDGTGHLTWDTSQVLTGVTYASLAWGDYDGDGDLDLLVMGHTGTAASICLYRNEPRGTLTAASMPLTALYAGSADWADWDGDGDVDLLLTGSDGSASQVLFYKNTPTGTLVADGSHGLTGVSLSDAAWGDFDNDGDLDLACTGSTGPGAPPTSTRTTAPARSPSSGPSAPASTAVRSPGAIRQRRRSGSRLVRL